jgi:capsular exopolysaccharide synthesis family protein
MSRIYDALKKLEAERSGDGKTNGQGNGQSNGHGNGHGNGNGNGHPKVRRRVWQWLFGGSRARVNGDPALNLNLGPEIEEAYQRLGTNLLVSPGPDTQQGPRMLGVVASRHGEGTTTTAAIFASILARRRTGRVCVVEANLRSPSFDKVFGLHPGGGLAELIRGERTLQEVTQSTPVPNLFAIGVGEAPGGASALFDSPGVVAVLEQLRAAFDFVIFDLAPANLYGDASIIGPRLDAALIVIEADRTRIPEAERTRRALERVGVRLVGSVLNRRRTYIPAFLEELL